MRACVRACVCVCILTAAWREFLIGWHRVIYWKIDSLACSGYSGTCFYIIITIRVCLSVCVCLCANVRTNVLVNYVCECVYACCDCVCVCVCVCVWVGGVGGLVGVQYTMCVCMAG